MDFDKALHDYYEAIIANMQDTWEIITHMTGHHPNFMYTAHHNNTQKTHFSQL